uniref:histidine kinase n=1 Tax=Chlorobium chlorochromatii (strain CaD3) TaxID=340177 RepID=Q3AQD1_CHLCH
MNTIIPDFQQPDAVVIALLDSFSDALFIMDADSIILHANEAFATQCGKKPEECIGFNACSLIESVFVMPHFAYECSATTNEVLDSAKQQSFETTYLHQSWKTTITPLHLKEYDQGATQLLVRIEDISEKKNLEQQSQVTDTLHKTLLETIPGFAIILDASGHLMAWNNYTRTIIFGKTDNEMYDVDPFGFICPTERTSIRKKFFKTLRAGCEKSAEIKIFPQKEKHAIWLLIHAKPVFIDNQMCVVAVGINITERKRVEAELLENKLRYNHAMEAARAGIWEWNVKTDKLTWSEQLWGLYGLQVNSEPLTHQLCVTTVHPDDREMASQMIKSAVQQQIPASIEYRVLHPDGSVHWLNSRGIPLHDDDGTLHHYIGTIIDITERKETEIVLLENKIRLKQALKATRAGVWEWELATNENSWSDEIWALYGIEQDHQQPSFDLWVNTVHPDDRLLAIKAVTEATQQGAEINVEYRVCHHDGSEHWLMSRGKPILDPQGNTIRYIGTALDITERKKMEIALGESQRRFTFALEATNAGVWEWDIKTDVITWTERVWTLYGLEPFSATPSHQLCATHVHHDDYEKIFQNIMVAVQRESNINVEYRVCHPDGTTHWLMCRGMPLRNANGTVSCYMGTVMDITKRRELLEKLRRSEQRYRLLFDNMMNGFAYCNMIYDGKKPIDFVFLNVNQTFKKFCKTKDVVGKKASEVIPNFMTLANELFVVCARVAHSCQSEQFEYFFKPFNEWLFISISSPQKGYFMVIFDIISERKRAEQLILDSKLKLEAALESMSDAIFISDTAGRFIEFNNAFAAFHKFERKEKCFMTLTEYPAILDLFTDNNQLTDLAEWPVSRALQGETMTNAEYTLHRKDTNHTWIGSYNYAPIRNNEGEITGSVVTARDITEQKLIEKTLKESELKFRSIFDYSPVAIGIGNATNGMLIDVNTFWLELFGYTKEEVVNQTVTDIGIYVKPQERNEILDILAAHGRVTNKPVRLRKKSGEYITILYSSVFMKLDHKTILLVIITDVTLQEIQQQNITLLEKAVAERTQQLQDEVEQLQRFISMISHEYRTPLAIIRGNLDLIGLKNKTKKISNEAEINKINRAIDRLVEVMEVSMQESRMIESKQETVMTTFQIAAIVTSQIETFRAMWTERLIIYSETVENSLVLGEPSQLKLAIFNLLDNARKYSPTDSPIKVTCSLDADTVMIRIRNYGTSITKDEEKTLFEKFQRGSNSMNTSGAGLGLWLVKSIINRHNGQVSLTCIDSGVETLVRLPLHTT